MLAVQIGGLLQSSPLKVMQRLPRHLDAFKIAPCPSLSVCLCCCSMGLELRSFGDPSPGILLWPNHAQAGERVLVLWRLPVEITSSCCRAELGHGGELVFKQIIFPPSSFRQLCGKKGHRCTSP